MKNNYDLRVPKTIEELVIDCQDKINNDAQDPPPKTIDIMPMTEIFLDIAQRILQLEERK